jgi:hypothetical protein
MADLQKTQIVIIKDSDSMLRTILSSFFFPQA